MNRCVIPMQDRFWDKVDIPSDPDNCWEWNSAKRNGYGVIGKPGRGAGLEYAHRLSFTLFHGDIPEGMDVCHACNNRACVNFTHIYAGTRSDNMQQAKRQGRLKRPFRPWTSERMAAHKARTRAK